MLDISHEVKWKKNVQWSALFSDALRFTTFGKIAQFHSAYSHSFPLCYIQARSYLAENLRCNDTENHIPASTV